MTTIAPIDLEKSDEAAVLIDYENIRLSWEKAYSRLFTYTDLCWLCELNEHRFRTTISRVTVFMSDPTECEDICCAEQLEEMKKTLKCLQEDQARKRSATTDQLSSDAVLATAVRTNSSKNISIVNLDNSPTSSKIVKQPTRGRVNHEGSRKQEDGRKKRRRLADSYNEVVDLSSSDGDEEHSNSSSTSNHSYEITQPDLIREGESPHEISVNHNTRSRSSSFLKEEGSSDSDISYVSSTPPEVSSDDDIEITSVIIKDCDDSQPFTRLGLTACPKADVSVKVFQYKRQRNSRVQKGCDVEIGVEVTKICFMPFFSSIFLFSADSDFEQTTRDCAQAEVYGGIIKYAKPIRILGFSRAFGRSTFLRARDEFYERKNIWSQLRRARKDITDVNTNAGASFYLIDYEFPSIKRILEKNERPLLPPSAFHLKPRKLLPSPPQPRSLDEVATSLSNSEPALVSSASSAAVMSSLFSSQESPASSIPIIIQPPAFVEPCKTKCLESKSILSNSEQNAFSSHTSTPSRRSMNSYFPSDLSYFSEIPTHFNSIATIPAIVGVPFSDVRHTSNTQHYIYSDGIASSYDSGDRVPPFNQHINDYHYQSPLTNSHDDNRGIYSTNIVPTVGVSKVSPPPWPTCSTVPALPTGLENSSAVVEHRYLLKTNNTSSHPPWAFGKTVHRSHKQQRQRPFRHGYNEYNKYNVQQAQQRDNRKGTGTAENELSEVSSEDEDEPNKVQDQPFQFYHNPPKHVSPNQNLSQSASYRKPLITNEGYS